ncbi:MAG TPA: hypothetical protein ENK18_15895 [Deltaproteobacteria bacterium]|nr:hypothetical protein [Deltaproteobacteria bacterium]
MQPRITPVLPPTPDPAESFSVMTFNVLLPNGDDGWWIEKMYQHRVQAEHRSWPRRQRLLAKLILGVRPDLLCLQETSPGSFEDDFRFLTEAGYGALIHRRSRLSPATFWRRDRFEIEASFHHDRLLFTTLSPAGSQRRLHLLNVHLTAGASPGRRLRQIHEGLERVRKQLSPGEQPAVLVCGDFNGHGPTGVRQLLSRGTVPTDFEEPWWPGVQLSSRVRSHALGPFTDAYVAAYHPDPPPPTLIAPRLHTWMEGPDGGLSPVLLDALTELYQRFGPEPWDRATTERWLTTINGRPDRGSERVEIDKIFDVSGEESLSLEQLISIYARVLRAGRPWAIDEDLHRCGVEHPPADQPPCEVRLDAIWHSAALSATAVRPPWSDEERRRVREDGISPPHEHHPSDHLPLAAVIHWGSQAPEQALHAP